MSDIGDALGDVIDAGTAILTGVRPVIGMKGHSTIEDRRIKRLADAIMVLRDKLGYNNSKESEL